MTLNHYNATVYRFFRSFRSVFYQLFTSEFVIMLFFGRGGRRRFKGSLVNLHPHLNVHVYMNTVCVCTFVCVYIYIFIHATFMCRMNTYISTLFPHYFGMFLFYL